jgi:hypothetical protein
MGPEYALHHYLASRQSFYGDGDGSDISAENVVNFVPIVPFTYSWFHDSVAFSATGWTDPHWTADANAAAYGTSFAVAANDRAKLWLALNYPDPHRPYRVRLPNLILSAMGVYARMIKEVYDDWGALFTTASINTVPVTKDNSRYLSPFRQPAEGKSLPLTSAPRSAKDVKRSKPRSTVRGENKVSGKEVVELIETAFGRQLENLINSTGPADFVRKSAEVSRFVGGQIWNFLTKDGQAYEDVKRNAADLFGMKSRSEASRYVRDSGTK